MAGTKQGAEEVVAFFMVLRRANIRVTLDPAQDPATGIDTFGDSTVVEVHRGQGQVTTMDTSGNPVVLNLNALNCTHYHISNGRIDRVQVYISDQHTVDAFFNGFLGSACVQDILSASTSSSLLISESRPVVQPCLPQAFGIGLKTFGARRHLKCCSSGLNLKFAVRPSAAKVT